MDVKTEEKSPIPSLYKLSLKVVYHNIVAQNAAFDIECLPDPIIYALIYQVRNMCFINFLTKSLYPNFTRYIFIVSVLIYLLIILQFSVP